MRHHPFLSFGLTSFVVTQSEAIHINAGIIRCVDLVLPEASVVNSKFPASCGMRITTAMRIHDMVLGALAQALPGQVPAGGGNTLVITYISTSELGTQGRVVVANPVPDLRRSLDETVFAQTRAMVRDFSELLEAVTESVEDDSLIDADEADDIRQKWEDLKACVEKFTVSCEKGHFHLKRK